MILGSNPRRAKCFTSLQNAQSSLRPIEASYPKGMIGFIPGVKRRMSEAGRSPPSTVEVKNDWRYTFAPFYVFILVYEELYLHDICG